MCVELYIPTFEVDFGVLHDVGSNQDTYKGDYKVTPTSEEQVLQTKNKVLTNNVIVAPIPSNYGMISWNGATLKVE